MNIPFHNQQFFDNSGKPLSGGKIYSYTAGSTNLPKPLYSDSSLTTPTSNPLILDSAGRPGAYFMTSGGYLLVMKDVNDQLIESWDYQFGTTSNGTSGAGSDTYKSMVDQYDTNPDYLVNKINSGDGIDVVEVIGSTRTLEINSQGKVKTNAADINDYLGNKFTNTTLLKWSVVGNKMVGTVELSAADQSTFPGDHRVICNGVDTYAGYLEEKIVGVGPVLVTTESSGQDQQIHIDVPDIGKVKLSGNDELDYLQNKIKAGAGITITSASDINGTKLYINSRTNSWRPIKYVSSNYVVQDTDDTIVVRGNFSSVTLPTASAEYEGRLVTVQAAGIGYGCSVVAASGSIVGISPVIYNYNKITFICVNDSSTWVWIAS